MQNMRKSEIEGEGYVVFIGMLEEMSFNCDPTPETSLDKLNLSNAIRINDLYSNMSSLVYKGNNAINNIYQTYLHAEAGVEL